MGGTETGGSPRLAGERALGPLLLSPNGRAPPRHLGTQLEIVATSSPRAGLQGLYCIARPGLGPTQSALRTEIERWLPPARAWLLRVEPEEGPRATRE